MKLSKKLCIMAAILVVAAAGFLACTGDDDGSPTGFSPIEYTPPTSSNTSNTPTNPPPPPPSDDDPITFEWTRGKDFFGVGFSCSRNGVGTDWKSKVVEVKVTNNTDDEIEMGYKVFCDKETGCAATVTPRAGADDIFVLIDGPEMLGPGESAFYRWRIDLTQFPGIMCGRCQFGWGFKYTDDDGQRKFWNERDRVINTGEENCSPPPPPPPPPGCPANDDSFINATPTEGEGSYCWNIEWGTSLSPCSVQQDGVEFSTTCSGGLGPVCFEPGQQSVDHTWTLVPPTCDPDVTVTVPPRDPCANPFLNVEYEINGNNLKVFGSSSSDGSVSALGVDNDFGPGNFEFNIPIPDPVCGREFTITASNECEDTENIEVETDECDECEGSFLDVDVDVQGNDVNICVDSSHSGNLIASEVNHIHFEVGQTCKTFTYSCDHYGHWEAITECNEDDGPFRTDPCPPVCDLNPPNTGSFCLAQPITGGGQNECDKFAPGSVFLSKVESSSVTAPDAFVAIVKGNVAQCEPSEHGYQIFADVNSGTLFELPGQSHVTFCGCPPITNGI